MDAYLLIGAGFSRNWGGWLASEAFEYLLGDPAVARNEGLRALLWKHQEKGGFEAALDELRNSSAQNAKTQERELRSAVLRMFDTMNFAFKSQSLEFRATMPNDVPVRNFLLRFTAIFSLNQDLLLEHGYRGSRDGLVDIDNLRTERDWTFPGMRLISNSDGRPRFPTAAGIWVPSESFSVPEDMQPIYKLHGSSNWRTTEDSEMLILGGGKARAIERFPVLRKYADIFTGCLKKQNARLMIVGYSFRDDHINDTLMAAIETGLKVFVIDPLGADVAAATNPFKPKELGYKLLPIEESMRKGLVGASRRPLASTFGSDEVERRKIDLFFPALSNIPVSGSGAG